ncbi:hypothetical protein RYH80_14710 [Halobaculum sp. MBLA0147]|uniref:DUF7344 domain-containing protein n=1 Tax=Halobaculum sp. MBLA0147 TaxID=3079934 RepID=UPI00352323AC
MSLTREPRPEEEQGQPEGVQTDQTLDHDEVFTLLKNRRRRAVLSLLSDVPETTLSDLADEIAADENDTTPDRLSSSQRKRVYISLYQNHLPKLADAGVIEYDRNRGDIRRLPTADRLQRYLDRLEGESADSGVGTVHRVGGAVAVVSIAGSLLVPGSAVTWALVAGVALLAVTAFEQVDSVDSPLRTALGRIGTLVRGAVGRASPRSRIGRR